MKVIICDDEKKVCNLIAHLVDWASLNMECVNFAYSGYDLIELAQECRPDLIITDVRIPGCSGAELIKTIKKICPETDFILISGYNYDEYTQNITDYDIVDYLLKPISKDALYSALSKARDHFLLKSGNVVQEYTHTVNSSHKIMRDSFFTGYLSRADNISTSLEQLNLHYAIELQPGAFIVPIFRIDSTEFEHLKKSQSLITQRLDLLLNHLLPDLYCSYYHVEDYCISLLLNYPLEKNIFIRRKLRELNYELSCNMLVFPDAKLTLGLGKSVTDIGALPDAADESYQLAMQCLVNRNSAIIEAMPDRPVSLSSLACWSSFLKSFRINIAVLDISKFTTTFTLLWNAILPDINSLVGLESLHLFKQLGQTFWYMLSIGGHDIPSFAEFSEKYLNCLRTCPTLKEIFVNIPAFFGQALYVIKNRQQWNRSQEILKLRQYIDKHYAEPLTVQSVAAETKTKDPDKLIQQEFNVTFVDYLDKIRLDHAKKLLRDVTIPLGTVYSIVGYPDKITFRKNFLKVNSVTPKVFRKLYSKE